MAIYGKPSFNQIPFKFTPGGYQKPPFGQVPFNFGKPIYSTSADLQAAINVISQASVDLSASITGKFLYETADLSAFVRSYEREQKDLLAFVRPKYVGYKDLVAHLAGFKGLSIERDLPASLYGIPPIDLQAILNVIEIRDLSAAITGSWWKGQADLGGRAVTFYRESFDLNAYIRTTFMIVDFPATINIISYEDLRTYLNTLYVGSKDLFARINQIYMIDLPAFLRGGKGFAIEKNLSAYLTGEYGPYDIRAYINTVPPRDLSAYIKGFKGIQIPFDLKATVESYYAADLQSTISAITAFDLGAYINSQGKSAILSATIIPKIIYLKKALNVALLEHKDLKAVINFMCFASDFKNLSGYLKAIYKLDLKGSIIGWYANMADNNAIDLKCYMNTAIYDVEDKINIRFIPGVDKYTLLKLKFNAVDQYTVFDTLPTLFKSCYVSDLSAAIYGGFTLPVNLSATIRGIFTSFVGLGASLTPVFDYNYTELPTWIRPKTHEIVINLKRFEEQWRKTVEIMFDTKGDKDFHYFYVGGENKIYRVDRDRHWVVWAKSYTEDNDNMIERRNVRYKYIFKMSDYNNMDEAIRDLIDRVSTYREAQLAAYINGGLPPYLDLSAYVSSKVKWTWQIHLKASLIGRLRFYQETETGDLEASIIGT